jgi:predicted CopG family antitoxin
MVAKYSENPRGIESKTIRVGRDVYDQLNALSSERQSTIGEVVADLVKERTRRDFYAKMREGYRALREDPAAWDEFQEEMSAWDVTLNDGLEKL